MSWFGASLGLFYWGFFKVCFFVWNYFVSRYCPLMVNKFKSNILSPIPSTDQERTLTFWHSPAARTHAHSIWTNRNSLIKTLNLEWPVLWNHKEEPAPRTKQECHIEVVRKDSRGLPAATETFITYLLLLSLSLFPRCPAWFCLQLVLSPEKNTVLKTSVLGSAWLKFGRVCHLT